VFSVIGWRTLANIAGPLVDTLADSARIRVARVLAFTQMATVAGWTRADKGGSLVNALASVARTWLAVVRRRGWRVVLAVSACVARWTRASIVVVVTCALACMAGIGLAWISGRVIFATWAAIVWWTRAEVLAVLVEALACQAWAWIAWVFALTVLARVSRWAFTHVVFTLTDALAVEARVRRARIVHFTPEATKAVRTAAVEVALDVRALSVDARIRQARVSHLASDA